MKSFLLAISLVLASLFGAHSPAPEIATAAVANSAPTSITPLAVTSSGVAPTSSGEAFSNQPPSSDTLSGFIMSSGNNAAEMNTTRSPTYVTQNQLAAEINNLRALIYQLAASTTTAITDPQIAANGNGVYYGGVAAPAPTASSFFSTLTASEIPPLSSLSGLLGIGQGGTGLSASPIFGQLLVGNGSGGYTLTATSSLGISGGDGSGTVGTGTQGQFPFYSVNGTTLTATSSLFISPSGDIGIGTTSPANMLTVSGAGQFTGLVAIGNAANTGLTDNNPALTGPFQSGLRIHNDLSGDLSVDTSNILYDSLDDFSTYTHTGSGGLVSLGINAQPTITSNSTGQIYFLSGINAQPTNYGSGITYNIDGIRAGPTNRGSGEGNLYGVESGISSDNGIVDAAGGLLVDNPIFNGGTVTNNYGLYISDQTSSGSVQPVNNYQFFSNANGGAEPFVQLSTGNVGIGTTSPGSLLSLGGIANFTTATSTFYSSGGVNISGGCFSINGSCLSTSGSGNMAGTQGQVAYFTGSNSAAGTSSLFISSAGNVGIGTTNPLAALTVNSAGGASITATDPQVGNDPNDRRLMDINVTTDSSNSNSGFTDENALQITENILNGQNSYGGGTNAKRTFIPLAITSNATGAGQRFLITEGQNCYGMGDCFALSRNVSFAGGDIGGDEGQGIESVSYLHQQNHLNLATVTSVPTKSSCDTTLTQGVTGSKDAQTVTVASSAGCQSGDWVVVEQELPTGFPNNEAVQLTGVGSGTLTGVFFNNHNSGRTITPALVLNVDSSYQFGQQRVLVNLSGASYAAGTVSSIVGGEFIGTGTSWSSSMVGGNSTNIGCIALSADDYSGAPFNGTGQSGTLKSWFQILAPPSATSLGIMSMSVADDQGYNGKGPGNGSYIIRPCAEVLTIVGNQLILETTSTTWSPGDSVELAIAPYPDVTGLQEQVAAYTNGGTYRSYYSILNSGARTFADAIDISSRMPTGGGADTVAWNSGIDVSSSNIGISIGSSTYAGIGLSQAPGNAGRIAWGDPSPGLHPVVIGETPSGNGFEVNGSGSDTDNTGALTFIQSTYPDYWANFHGLLGLESISGNNTGTRLRFYNGGGATSPGDPQTATTMMDIAFQGYCCGQDIGLNFIASSTSQLLTVLSLDGTTGNAVLAGTLTQTSDQRLKTNIQLLDASSTLARIDQLNPVTFNWIDPNQGAGPQVGFIAQDVQKIFPQLVSTTSPTALTPGGTFGLNYIGLIAPLVSSVQALSSELQSLAATVAGFAQSFTSQHITTQQLCVADQSGAQTCISKSELDALLAPAGVGASVSISEPTVSVSSVTPPLVSMDTASSTATSTSPSGDVASSTPPNSSNSAAETASSTEASSTAL